MTTDVEQIVNRHHDQCVSQTADEPQKTHRKKLLKLAVLFTLICCATVVFKAVGQIGEPLSAVMFEGSLSCAMFYLGCYFGYARKK